MQYPKLRDKRTKQPNEPYPPGLVPESVIHTIAKWIVYSLSTGKTDINGENWGNIFSKAVSATHLNSPVGLADVVLEKWHGRLNL